MPNSNSNVEERIVEMRIDNKKFEAGANASIKTLEKLEKALNIKSNSNAIDEMTRSVEKFDVSPITKGFDLASISLGDFIKTAAGLTLVTNAMDDVYAAGKRMVKSLTTDQLKAGFDKYENMTESTQMIMATTRELIGTPLEDGWIIDATGAIRDAEGNLKGFVDEAAQMANVNAQLEKLLWFTDETSYSFTDMTGNVGKFLGAGVGLEEATNAMMGIAVWGASAGAKTQEVSRAMYNISQAVGSGKMTLMDWKSIENANMATLEVKKNILAIAAQKGVLSDIVQGENYDELNYTTILDPEKIKNMTEKEVDAIINAKNFRESLSQGWLTTDVMTEVFTQYGSFANMLYEATDETGLEARGMLDLLKEFRDAGEDADETIDWEKWASETRVDVGRLKELIKGLDDLGIEYAENGFRMGQEAKTWSEAVDATKDAVSSGWMTTFQLIFGDYLQAKEFWSDVTDEFWEIFASGAERRNDILEAWNKLGGRDSLLKRLEEGEAGVNGILWNIVDAIHSITDPIHEAFEQAFGLGINDIDTAAQKLYEFTERVRKFTEQLQLSEEAQEGLRVTFQGIFSILKAGLKVVGGALSIFNKALLVVKSIFDDVLSIIGLISKNNGGKIIKDIAQNVKKAFDERGLSGAIKALQLGFTVLEKEVPGLSNHLDNIRQTISNVYTKVEDFISTLIPAEFKLSNVFEIIKNGASDGYSIFKRLIESFNFKGLNLTWIESAFNGLVKAVSAIYDGMFGEGAELKDRIGEFVANVWDGFVNAISKISVSDAVNALRLSILASIASTILGAVSIFKETGKEIKTIPESLTKMFGNAGDAFKSLSKSFKANILIKIAVSIAILAGSFYLLAQIPANDLTRVISTFAMLLGLCLLIGKIISKSSMFSEESTASNNNFLKFISKFAMSLIAVGIAISIAVNAMVKLSTDIASDKLWSSFAVVASLMAIMSAIGLGFVLLLKTVPSDSIKKVGATVLKIALAMLVMSLGVSIIVKAMNSLANNQKVENVQIALKSIIIVTAAIGAIFMAFIVLLQLVPENSIKKIGSAIVKIAIAFLIISVAMSVLLKAISALSMSGSINNLWTALAIVGVVAIIISGIMAGFILLLKTIQPSQISKIASNLNKISKSMVIIVASIVLLTIPIMILGALGRYNIDFTSATLIVAGLALMMTAVIGALILMFSLIPSEKINKVANSIIKVSASMILIASTLAILMIPVSVIAALAAKGTDVWKAVGIIAVLTVILVAFAALAGFASTKINATAFVAIAAGIVLLALALLILTPALTAMIALVTGLLSSSKAFENFGKTMLKLAGVAVVILLLGAALAVLGASAVLFGVFVVLFAVGLLAMAGALIAVGAAIPAFLEGLIAAGKLISKDNFKDLAKGAAVLLVLAAAAALLAKAFKDLTSDSPDFQEKLSSFGENVQSIGEKLLSGINVLFSNIGKTIVENFPAILAVLGGLLGVMLAWLTGMLPTIVDTIMKALIVLLETLNQSLNANLGAIEHAIFGIIITLIEVVYDALTWAASMIVPVIVRLLIDVLDEVLRSIIGDKAADKVRKALKLDELVDNMNENATSEEAMANRQARRDEFHDFIEGYNVPEQEFVSVAESTKATLGLAEETQAQITKGSEEALAGINELAENAGVEGGESFLGGLGDTVSENFETTALPAINEAVTDGMTEGDDSTENSIANALSNILGGVSSDSGFLNGIKNIAGNFISGLANGILDGSPVIADAVTQVTGGMIVAGQEGLDEHSPSRIAEQMGAFFSIGLANGVEKEGDMPADSVTVMASGMLAAIQMAMMQVAALANEDMDISPVISPVVDMTNVDSAAGYMSGAFSGAYGMTMGMSDSINRRLSDVERLASNMNELGGGQTINGDQITVNVYPTPNQDPTEIADAVIERINSRSIRRGVAFGY